MKVKILKLMNKHGKTVQKAYSNDTQMLSDRLRMLAGHISGPTLQKSSKFKKFHFLVTFHKAMLVVVGKTFSAFSCTPDAEKTFKTFVCVQRAIKRM